MTGDAQKRSWAGADARAFADMMARDVDAEIVAMMYRDARAAAAKNRVPPPSAVVEVEANRFVCGCGATKANSQQIRECNAAAHSPKPLAPAHTCSCGRSHLMNMDADACAKSHHSVGAHKFSNWGPGIPPYPEDALANDQPHPDRDMAEIRRLIDSAANEIADRAQRNMAAMEESMTRMIVITKVEGKTITTDTPPPVHAHIAKLGIDECPCVACQGLRDTTWLEPTKTTHLSYAPSPPKHRRQPGRSMVRLHT